METRTYTERSNARRAARAFGVNLDLIHETEDGFTFDLPDRSAKDDERTPLKQAIDAAVERGMTPSQFVAAAEQVADGLDIPQVLKLTDEQRRAGWEKNPPKSAASKPKESLSMPKTSKSAAGKSSEKPVDKTALLLTMLKKGATVEAMTEALGWLPHTLRARISRLHKPKSKGGEGMKIERDRKDGVTSYKIAA